MEEGEQYAIETFGSTGNGIVLQGPDCSHYMLNYDYADVAPTSFKTKALLFSKEPVSEAKREERRCINYS